MDSDLPGGRGGPGRYCPRMQREVDDRRPTGNLLWRRLAVLVAATILGVTIGTGFDDALRGLVGGAAFGVIIAATLREL